MLAYRIMGLRAFHALSPDLAKAHFTEASSYNKELELDMNWEVYSSYEQAGLLQIAGAFDDKRLVGYAFVIKVPNLLHKQVVFGMVQFIYLDPAYRKGRNGLRLIKFAENIAKVLGCNYVTFSISKKQSQVLKMFTGLGYSLREAVISKRL
jgi:GNAT superfamily N-acetyltransferase